MIHRNTILRNRTASSIVSDTRYKKMCKYLSQCRADIAANLHTSFASIQEGLALLNDFGNVLLCIVYIHTHALSLSLHHRIFVPTENAVRNTSLISSATRCRWNRPKSGSTSSTTGPTTSFLSLARSSNGTAVSSVQFSTHTHFHLLLRNLFAVYSLFTQCASGPRLAG
jgi:hypothetical protein